MRILLSISYLGTAYVGWQFQENGPSVQEAVEDALLKGTGDKIRVTGASRTDAGVHALCQMAHFDTASTIPPERFPFVLNRYLPPDIRVYFGQRVDDAFHARFDAERKTYTYRFFNAPHASAVWNAMTCHVPLPLDDRKMDTAVRSLLGEHDFCAFAAAGGQAKTTVRTLFEANVERQGPFVTFRVTGSGFLYNMVRIIAGTLIYIGQGKLSPDCFKTALATGDRLALGPTAPPGGLELSRIRYAARWELLEPPPYGDGVPVLK